jgi:hypothetical protein
LLLYFALQKCKSKDEASIVGALSTIKHLLPRFSLSQQPLTSPSPSCRVTLGGYRSLHRHHLSKSKY